MTRSEAMNRFAGFGEDTVVRSLDGDKLGAITYLGEEYFVVEKGIFFPRDLTLSYDDIEGLQSGELFVKHERAAPGTRIGMFGGGAFGATPDMKPKPMQEVDGTVGLEGVRDKKTG